MSKSEFQEYTRATISALTFLPDENLLAIRQCLRNTAKSNGVLWVVGNGGSAATASHFVADLVKTTKGFSGNSLKTVALHELQSLQTAYANDISFEHAFSHSLADLGESRDCLLILSVSGTSPNLVAAEKKATEMGMNTVCIVGSRGVDLAEKVTYGVCVNSADYQVVENIHVIILHWLARTL